MCTRFMVIRRMSNDSARDARDRNGHSLDSVRDCGANTLNTVSLAKRSKAFTDANAFICSLNMCACMFEHNVV